MSTTERAPLAPIPGLQRGVAIPPPPQRARPDHPGPVPAAPDPDTVTERPADPGGGEDGDSAAARTATPGQRGAPVAADAGGTGPGTATRARRPVGAQAADLVGGGRPRASDAVDLPRPITLSLPAALVARLKERAATDRVSQPEVLLDALSATATQLPDLVRATHVRPTRSGLFLRTPPRGPAEPMATLSMRVLTRNVETIDALVQANEAPSRSALCAAALRRYLNAE